MQSILYMAKILDQMVTVSHKMALDFDEERLHMEPDKIISDSGS